MSKLIINNGFLVDSKGISTKNILIKEGVIVQISDEPIKKTTNEDQVIDAKGKHVLPGIIDPQVHFRDPGLTRKEDLATGSKAAVAGSVTSFLEMPNTIPNTITANIMADKKKIASKKCFANYNFFIGATNDNLDELNNTPNVCGIKIFMGSSTGDLLVDDPQVLERIFSQGDRLIAVHAELENILKKHSHFKTTNDFCDHPRARPVEAALGATKLALSLAKKYRRRLHILHLTTEEEVELLRKEKESFISAEVCPQHLFLSAPEAYKELGSLAQVNPPIREKRHALGLWKGLKEGVVDCIATDHAAHTLEEKNLGYGQAPSGAPGVETSLPLMLNQVNKGTCSLKEVVKWMCEQPALLYQMKSKGFLQPGFDGDVTIVDMEMEKTVENGKLHNKSNWSPFHGWTLKGWPLQTIVGGHLVFDKGVFDSDHHGKEIKIG